jgi:hypothetical protein
MMTPRVPYLRTGRHRALALVRIGLEARSGRLVCRRCARQLRAGRDDRSRGMPSSRRPPGSAESGGGISQDRASTRSSFRGRAGLSERTLTPTGAGGRAGCATGEKRVRDARSKSPALPAWRIHQPCRPSAAERSRWVDLALHTGVGAVHRVLCGAPAADADASSSGMAIACWCVPIGMVERVFKPCGGSRRGPDDGAPV